MPLPGPLSVWSDEQLFALNFGALPAWALLILAPRWKWTPRVAQLTSAFFALLYIGLFVSAGMPPTEELFTFNGVTKLMSRPNVVLPAWVHFVCFDLLVACWGAMDAVSRGIPKLMMAPVLVLTCLFGPTGYLLYVAAVRPFFGRASGAVLKHD